MKRFIVPILAVSLAFGSSASADLLGYWDFEGNFDDASGNGNDGILLGGATYVADAPVGITGTMSVAFDGQPGTYGDINPGLGMAITALPSYTVSMWVKGDGTANSDDRVFSEGLATDPNPLFNIGTHNSSADARLDVYIRNGGNAETFGHAYTTGDAFDSTWHHIVFSGGEDGLLDVYIDGVFDQQFDYSRAPIFTAETTTIGGILRDTDCCNFFGNIDDLAVWDQQLIAEDIASIANGSVSPPDLEPTPADIDMDGMLDAFEQLIIDADPGDGINSIADVLPGDDFDSDGSTNDNEESVGTDPIDDDSDDDGALDGSETNTGVWVSVTDRGTDPLDPDSDNDDLSDGVENPDLAFDPANPTTQPGSDPNMIDTDMDNISDGFEAANGTDPTDADDPGALPTLFLDFNSTTQGGGPNAVGLPYQDYNAGHEVAEDFVRQEYSVFDTAVGVTPSWPDSADNRVMQMIDRGAGNDAQWLGTQVELLTDWLGVDTRTANGGNGDYDGVNGIPTSLLLTLDSLPGGSYDWTSFHHDTENIHSLFTAEISTDGGANFESIGSFQMTSSSTGGNPVNPATETGPDPQSLSSTVRHSFTTDGQSNIVFRFVPLAQTAVHQQFFAINGFELAQTSSNFSKFAITSLVHDIAEGTVTITWPSTPGQEYTIETSADLVAWTGDLEDGWPAAEGEEETSYTFDIDERLAGESEQFIRVRIN